jgi:hypothetical protein
MLANPDFERRLDKHAKAYPHISSVICWKGIFGKRFNDNREYVIRALRIETCLSIIYKEAAIDTLSTLAKFQLEIGGQKRIKYMHLEK